MDVSDPSEDVIFSYPEWQASTFAVDRSGRRAVLAVQKWLAVVNLDEPDSTKPIRKLARQNKYDIKAVYWNPTATNQDLLASTSQQKLEVWNVSAERHPNVYSIKAHTRPVSDLSWSFTDPNLLSSCAVDSFVHVWDIRDAKRPKISFKAVAGASLVQCNRLNGNVVASAHDSDIRIWDMRKPSTASGYISAHMSRIHDLDWSHSREKELTTCSHDASIKFWDTSSPREPLSTIKVPSQPMWRARNYPAGQGVAMVLVPAMHSGDSRVFLWSRSNVSAPLHVFTGHTEAILEVQWRQYRGDYQLMTWSKDRTLRVWGISDQLRGELGVEQSLTVSGEEGAGPNGRGREEEEDVDSAVGLSFALDASRKKPAEAEVEQSGKHALATQLNRDISTHESSSPSTPPLLMRSIASSSREPPDSPTPVRSAQQVFQSPATQTSLAQEFSLLNLDNIPNLTMERMEPSIQRSCTVKVEEGGHLVRLAITFPSHYPNNAAPSFTFDRSTTIDITSQQELVRVIRDTAQQYVKANRPCLEACLKRLAKSFETFVTRPQPPTAPTKKPDFDIAFGHLDDEHIPFPRTSGARFCANGFLVCFSLPPGLHLPTDVRATPRSIDKLTVYRSHIHPGSKRWGGYMSSSLPKRGSGPNLQLLQVPGAAGRDTTSSLYPGDSTSSNYAGLVSIHDLTNMLPIDISLARSYSLQAHDIAELCTQNASVAAAHGHAELIQAWAAAALIADEGMKVSLDPYDGVPWSVHPFGRQLIHSLFDHFANLRDVQTLAMLACVFQMHKTQLIAPKHNGDLNNYSMNGTKTVGDGGSTTDRLSPTKKLQASFQMPSVNDRYTVSERFTASEKFITSEKYSVIDRVASVAVTTSLPLMGGGLTRGGSGGSLSEANDVAGNFEKEDEQQAHEANCKLLDDLLTRKCDEYRRTYANILYSWGMLDQRAEILKFQSHRKDTSKDIGFASLCRKCNETVIGPTCMKPECHCFAFTCSICNLAVRGSSNFCLSCGHGGHARHMLEWFTKYQVCPSGCGCQCLEASGWT